MNKLTAENEESRRVIDAVRMTEGDGAEVLRLFPLRAGRMHRDPFVLFDHFFLQQGTGFPTHPHRGFEAITYLFEGSMQHRDNIGNDSIVSAGGAQRFTAGRGIEHSEIPHGTTSGIQLWINLPLRLKSIEPDYQAVNAEDIPAKTGAGVTLRIIAGEGAPLKLQTPVEYLSIELAQNTAYKIRPGDDFQGFVYVVKGEVEVRGQKLLQGQALYFCKAFNAELSSAHGAHVMLCSGTPHGEPIRQYGPFVD